MSVVPHQRTSATRARRKPPRYRLRQTTAVIVALGVGALLLRWTTPGPLSAAGAKPTPTAARTGSPEPSPAP